MIELIITTGKLYEKCENMEQLYDDFYYPLMVEYKDLKKQLDERTKMYQNAYKYGQRMEDVVITLKAEQKEFIKYLEDMLDDENDIFSVVRVKDVLQKYREIIGDDNSGIMD